MADMLNNAVSGLLAFQRALSTTSHNIANVNTEGFSRQSVDIATQTPSVLGNSFFGNGVRVDAVTRAYDQFLTNEARATSTEFSRLARFTELAGQIDDLLADSQGGISPILNEFFASAQDLADDPSSSTARFQLINTAKAMATRFNTLDKRFDDLALNSSIDMRNVVDEINDIVAAIRDVNQALNESQSLITPSQQSADLLDKRDALLDRLAQKVSIKVVEEPNNGLSIFIGNGQTVLNGTEVFTLSAQPNPNDPSLDVIVYNGLITVNDLSDQISGGELGGLLDFRKNVLQPTRNAIGRVAIGITETFNTQHRSGMDLNNNLGTDFFSVGSPQVLAFAGNPGTANITTSISDVTALTKFDYTLEFDGANWTLASDSGTVSAAVANASPANTTVTFEGISLVIDGASAPAAGDRYRIKPTQVGAGTFAVQISDPNLIAAALPIQGSASLDNLGNVDISSGIVTDVTNPALLNPVTFTIDNPATTFQSNVDVVVGGVTITAGNPITFTNNMTIDANGWQVQLNGIAQPGDVLTVSTNAGGRGDNRNALNLGGLEHIAFFDNGLATYQDDYSGLVGFVGSQTHAAEISRDAQQALFTHASDRKASNSGVNLDEEAANLIKYQQAYEASARIISTVQSLFETLLNSVR